MPRQVASHGRSCVGGRWFVVDKAGLSLSKPLLETTKADTGICTTMWWPRVRPWSREPRSAGSSTRSWAATSSTSRRNELGPRDSS